MSAPATTILAELEALGSEANRAGMARYGINTDRAFGVSMAQLRPVARAHKKDHGLAAALWESGYHEARLLAVLVEDPKQVTEEQMDAWVAEFDSWDLCDQACMKLFDRTPFVEDKIRLWAKDEREFVRRAAFAMLAAHALHGKAVPDERYRLFLPLIEHHATDSRNFVKKAVNWALRQIGKRSSTLRGQAVELAEKLAASSDKTARWIGGDAARELTDPVQIERIKKRSAH